MVKLFLSWTNKWLFNQMLLWQSGEQSANWIKHQYNGQRTVIEKNLAQKCAGTIRKKVDSVFLHQREKNESHTLSDRQQGSLSLPFENGTNNKGTYDQINKKNLALSSKWQYAYHCRINAFSSEHSSQQKIKEKARLFKVASSSQSFFSSFLTTWFSDSKFICFLPISSTTSIHSLAFWSIQLGDECNDTKLEFWSFISISPFQYDFKSAPKN